MDVSVNSAELQVSSVSTERKIVGMFPLYDPAEGHGWMMELRQFEIFETLRRNIRAGVFDEIHLFFDAKDSSASKRSWPKNSKTKLFFHAVEDTRTTYPFNHGHLTFMGFMQWANHNLPDGTIALHANSDISFDDTLNLLRKNNDFVDRGSYHDWVAAGKPKDRRPQWLQLTRVNIAMDGISRMASWQGHRGGNIGDGVYVDAWAVITPSLPDSAGNRQWMNIPLGISSCDKQMTCRASNVGFDIINPGMTIYTYHLHNARWGFRDLRHGWKLSNKCTIRKGSFSRQSTLLQYKNGWIKPSHPPRRTSRRVPEAYKKWINKARNYKKLGLTMPSNAKPMYKYFEGLKKVGQDGFYRYGHMPCCKGVGGQNGCISTRRVSKGAADLRKCMLSYNTTVCDATKFFIQKDQEECVAPPGAEDPEG
jgi:hypothetical protein